MSEITNDNSDMKIEFNSTPTEYWSLTIYQIFRNPLLILVSLLMAFYGSFQYEKNILALLRPVLDNVASPFDALLFVIFSFAFRLLITAIFLFLISLVVYLCSKHTISHQILILLKNESFEYFSNGVKVEFYWYQIKSILTKKKFLHLWRKKPNALTFFIPRRVFKSMEEENVFIEFCLKSIKTAAEPSQS
jgi:hypothetical protein